MRARLRRLAFAAATLFGLPRGFFIPYRYAASAAPADYPALRPLFAAAEPRFAALLEAIEAYRGDLAEHRRRRRAGPLRPGLVPAPRRGRRLRARAPRAPAPHRRDRLRAFDALPGPRRRRRQPGDGDHLHRPGAPRRHCSARRASPPGAARRRRSGSVRRARRGRHPVHRFKPHRDAGHRRRPPGPRCSAAPRRGRARARPRHLPARRLPARMGMARLQRAAPRRSAHPGRRLRSRLRQPLRRDAHGRVALAGGRPRGACRSLPGAHETSLWLRKL